MRWTPSRVTNRWIAYRDGAPAAVVDGTLYVGSRYNAVCTAGRGDRRRWMVFQVRGNPMGVSVVDGVVYATSEHGLAYAIKASNGEKIWHFVGAG